jgi:fluoride ion exporter CrcB/FEX
MKAKLIRFLKLLIINIAGTFAILFLLGVDLTRLSQTELIGFGMVGFVSAVAISVHLYFESKRD